MNTHTRSLPLAAAFSRLRRPLRLVAALLLAASGACVFAQTAVPAITVTNESPNSFNCDIYRWTDSAGMRRSAALSRNTAADPGGSHGGVLYQYRFTPTGSTTERVITGTGARNYNGFGYVVNHYSDTAYVSTGTTGTYSRVLTGRHHAIHQFKLNYPLNGVNVAATIHWYFATGLDDPVYAITYDTSAAGAAGLSFNADSRAPYGDMQFGGDGTNPDVSGVAWGDKYKFTTTSSPLTPQSTWDYTQRNTVPFTQMWIDSPDAEMGAVQTLNWDQHNTGGSWFHTNWGHTSADRVDDGSAFGSWMMPTNWQWPYQLNQYELMDNTSPTGSKRCAWGLMYGAVGRTSYSGYGYENTYSGHPYQSYSVATVIGLHSTSAVQARVARTERVLAATLTATTGTLVSAGPGGAGRTDSVAYPKAGYNATYGAYELAAAAGAFSATLNTTGAIKNPTFIIRGMGGIPSTISLDGTALVADQGYFASYESANQTVWLTVATDWNGSHTLASGTGVPPGVAVVIDPATTTLGRGMGTTFAATVSYAANTAVIWSVVESGGGSITTGGAYTAPATLGTYHVRATSVADPTKFAEAAVAVVAPTVSVSPATFALAPSGSTTFTATVTNAANTAVTWSVLEPGGGSITTGGTYTAPTTPGTYHARATSVAEPSATAQATVTVASLTPTFTYIYRSGLQGGWNETGWGSTYDLSAGTLGHSGSTTIEVGIPEGWEGLALGDVGPGWSNITYYPVGTYSVLEFDIYIHSNSTGHDNVLLLLGDGSDVDTPSITELITGWSSMTTAQRFDQWHHVTVDLASLNPEFDSFFQIVFWKNSASGSPHFRLADIRMGSIPDVTAPTVTLGTPVVDYSTLTLPFTTDESAIYRVEYGYGDTSQTLTGPTDGWATTHNAVLTGLTRGETLTFRILAIDHAGNTGLATGSVEIVDPPPPTEPTVTITADPANTHPISPWIYGMNFYHNSAGTIRNLTVNRQGGNRWTAYNWENNASNAGADWYYHNDNYLGGGNTPGEALRPLVVADRARGNASLLTVQMQGYVAADKNGDDVTAVTPLATRLATRFKQVVYKKSTQSAAAFTTTPDASDAYVYMDEFVWAMNQLVPGGIYTDPVNPTMLMLDNEPELWSDTHAEIQEDLITPEAYIAKTIALSRAVKDVAPDVVLFGPVHYGFAGIYNWQGSSGFSATNWFTDRYLTELKAASDADGRRLVDVYNFNWYSEATDGSTRVTNLSSANLSEAQIQAVVQSPRSLWDPTFTETSWITQYITGGPIALLPKLQTKIDTIWPGTRLAITEWGNGGFNHIAGGIAVADNLGVFGQYDLFEASYWPLSSLTSTSFDFAAFRMYRDFDGALSTFGDVSIPAVSSNTALVSAYLSSDSVVPGRYVIVAINRSNAAQAVAFDNLPVGGTARLFRLNGTSTTPTSIGTTEVDLSSWIVALPAYTITTIEITASVSSNNYAAWRAANFSGADRTNDAVSGPAADPDGAGVSNLVRYACNLAARGPVAQPTTQGFATNNGDTFLTLSFARRTSADDLFYTVEWSDDLATWTTLEAFQPGSPSTVTAQDTVALGTADVSRRFLRLRVDITP